MASRQGRLRKASTRVTRLVTMNGMVIAGTVRFAGNQVVALAHWLKNSSSTGAMRLGTSALAALVRWVKRTSIDDVIVVSAETTEVENLGTEQIPINLPKIKTKRDLVVFDCVGQF